MSVVVGISGWKRNAVVAVARNGRLAAVCEQGRVTRVRDVGIRASGFPNEALDLTLRAAGVGRRDIATFALAEEQLAGLAELTGLRTPPRLLDHHRAHAATAFLTSSFADALVLVCDSHAAGGMSAWRGEGTRLERVDTGWRGGGAADAYSRFTRAIGLEAGEAEYQVEALARLGNAADAPEIDGLVDASDEGLRIAPDFDQRVDAAIGDRAPARIAAAAAALQERVSAALIELLRRIRDTGPASLCLGGGLFFNTSINTEISAAGLFDRVFVPVNPGNGGLAAGCALAVALDPAGSDRPAPASPFLGPEFTNQEIKAVLDNCKLSYDFVNESQAMSALVSALARGELVGFFRGRLEWGTRALGNRSIFASPFAPYVLENLNRFLKHRDAQRTYGLAVCEEDAAALFEGPASSPFMEAEYRIRDRARFAGVCPPGIDRVRLQTVGTEPSHLRRLLKAFGEQAGTPVLVNTSFNGFHEPIVCVPRDAVRVFYGTGLDTLVVGNFIMRK